MQTSREPIFLTVDQILELNREAIEQYGGSLGLRDSNLLESATFAPQQTFGGNFLYSTLPEMAATYWISLTANHPFIDGNKRVGLFACDTFLLLNGYRLTLSNPQVIELTLRIATSTVEREEIVQNIETTLTKL